MYWEITFSMKHNTLEMNLNLNLKTVVFRDAQHLTIIISQYSMIGGLKEDLSEELIGQ